jgi:UDP-N-acetylglucosamine 3-dehydrogenase
MGSGLETVHVGVVGLGSAGRGHLRRYRAMPKVEVVGIADVDEARLEALGKEYEVDTTTDYRVLLDDPRLQAVTICPPPFLHKEVVVAAAERGVHVHCEKPMALTLADCDAMIEACRAKDLILYISHEPRQLPAFRRVRELLASGEYGEPLWLMDRRLLPATPGVWMPPGWFWKRELGGGLLVENGSHHFDYIRWVMGEVETVWAQTATLKFKGTMLPYMEDPNIEDIAMVTMRHTSGAMSNLLNTCMVPCGNIFHLEAATQSHYLEMDRNERLIVECRGEVLFETQFRQNERVIISVEHFVECVREGKPPMNTGEDGRAAVELALAALESARREAPVCLPLEATA